ncbi:MAG: transposase-like protein [Cellvibrionaceae bacterium]|jgi:transposase-like protein
MIIETITNECTKCTSFAITKNGFTPTGKQKFYCKTCSSYGTLNPEEKYSAARKAEILKACHERSSLRGIERTFRVARQTVSKWLKKSE